MKFEFLKEENVPEIQNYGKHCFKIGSKCLQKFFIRVLIKYSITITECISLLKMA